MASGSEFLRFFVPVVEVLRDNGGSGRSAEVTDLALERLEISEAEQQVVLKSGQSRVRNQVAWVRLILVRAGLLSSSSKHGVWTLTDKGSTVELTEGIALRTYRETQRQEAERRKESKSEVTEELADDTGVDSVKTTDYRSELLERLQSLTPEGFEHICRRLLLESGFQRVVVTGKSGDGGIDGHGILRINPLVSFKVLFQCKRYRGTVSVGTIRDFRGALQGRADKGIVLTTGTFTTDAREEAVRDGATPIELVDGDALVGMFEELQLGLVPRADFAIDQEFFEEFN